MHCIKRLGERVMSRSFERQVNELHIRAAIMNKYTELGHPQTLAIAASGLCGNSFHARFMHKKSDKTNSHKLILTFMSKLFFILDNIVEILMPDHFHVEA